MRFNNVAVFAVALTAAVLDVSPAPALGEGAVITGVVQLPVSPPKRRSFRGDLYRNRLAPTKGRDTTATDAPVRSRFADVVISAHPLSFEALVEPLSATLRVDQVDAQFTPRVLVVTAGSTVEFVNLDRFYHNVFSLSRGNKFNIGRRPTGEVVAHTFDTPGRVEIFCDIHPQMAATIVVLDTPWFEQPDAAGRFRIDGLPPGRYRVRAVHPEHEPVELELEVVDGAEPLVQSFVFGR